MKRLGLFVLLINVMCAHLVFAIERNDYPCDVAYESTGSVDNVGDYSPSAQNIYIKNHFYYYDLTTCDETSPDETMPVIDNQTGETVGVIKHQILAMQADSKKPAGCGVSLTLMTYPGYSNLTIACLGSDSGSCAKPMACQSKDPITKIYVGLNDGTD